LKSWTLALASIAEQQDADAMRPGRGYDF
jgi:hypothetical protein